MCQLFRLDSSKRTEGRHKRNPNFLLISNPAEISILKGFKYIKLAYLFINSFVEIIDSLLKQILVSGIVL